MSANKDIMKILKSILYQGKPDMGLSEEDVFILQSYPADVIIPLLREIFYHSNDDVIKSRTYQLIIDFPKFDRVGFLLEVFDQSDANWQSMYCKTLSEYHDPRAVQKLCQIMLEHSEPDLRYSAAHALMVLGDELALPALEYVSKHDEGLNYLDMPVADIAHTGYIKIGHKLDPLIEKYTHDLYFRRGALHEVITEIETKFKFRFPLDYKEFLMVSNGASGYVGPSQLLIYPLDFLLENSDLDGSVSKSLPPGFFEFGMDLNIYAFDIRQSAPVFVEIPRANTYIGDIKVCGFSFQEFLDYLFYYPHRHFPFRYTPGGNIVHYLGE